MNAPGATRAMAGPIRGAGGPAAAGSLEEHLAGELHSVERLERSLRASAVVRRLFYACSLVFPSALALLMSFLALYPILFPPAERLTTTLASMVGAGLSFASVTFSAARVSADHRGHALRLVAAGSMLVRFAIAIAVSLVLATARDRLAAAFGTGNALDLPLRLVTGLVTVTGIGMAFFGFRTLVLLLGPEVEEDAAIRLHELLLRDSETPETSQAPATPQPAGYAPAEGAGPSWPPGEAAMTTI